MADAAKTHRRWKMAGSLVAGAGVAIWMGAWAAFSYVAPFRSRPDPSLGRVYGWPNHGTYVYLSRSEDLALNVVMVAMPVLFGCGALFGKLAERKVEPWERWEPPRRWP